MINFRTIFLVISTLIAAEYCRIAPPLPLAPTLALISSAVIAFSVYQLLLVRTLHSRDKNDSKCRFVETQIGNTGQNPLEHRRILQVKYRLESLWTFAYPITLLLTGWLAWVNWNVVHPDSSLTGSVSPDEASQLTHMGSSHLLGAILIFGPHLLTSLVAEWVTWKAHSEQTVGTARISFLSRLRFGELSSLLTCLFPFVVISAARDLLQLEPLRTVSPLVLCAAAAAGLLALLSYYPSLLGRWLGAGELRCTELAARVQNLSGRVRLGRVQVRELASDGRLCTAAVVGWFPWSRAIWLSDGLLDRLTNEEVDMVVLHEASHVKQHHFFYRLIPLAWSGALTGAYFCLYKTPPFHEIPIWLGSLLTSVCAAAVLLVGMGLIARRCELDADRGACELAETHCNWTQGKPGLAAARMATALHKTIGSHPSSSDRSWMHPSLRERLVSLADDLVRRKNGLTERPSGTEIISLSE